MRSKASFKGHPIHPALIPFPIAFLAGALIFDGLGVALDRSGLWQTGRHLAVAGIIAGLIAAMPGLIDYKFTVPPNSTGKKRATKHMIVNSSALAAFGIALLFRPPTLESPGVSILAIEALGVALLSIGGWMGGTLVSRNQISVDHRYAGAGKWKEDTIAAAGADVVIATSDELEVDQMKLLHVDGERIVLVRTETGYAAFADGCTHRGGSLADGVSICGTVQCPWHGSQFDVKTGAVKAGPAKKEIRVYPIEVKDGLVWLKRG